MYGDSELRRVEIETGKPTHSLAIPTSDFGEGLTLSLFFLCFFVSLFLPFVKIASHFFTHPRDHTV